MQRPGGSASSRYQRLEPRPGCVIFRARGEVDADSAPAFQEELDAAFDAAGQRLVIDLGQITYFDSAGIRCLIILRQRAGARHEAVRLVLPNRSGVRRVLEIASVAHLFPVARSVDEALSNPEAA